MSTTWMNDAAPNHNGNGFPRMNDPDTAGAMMDPSVFMANPGQFNPAQLQQQQQQAQQQMQALQNAPMRNASPSTLQNGPYQTNPVIPSKRPRPREDSIAGSPTQNQNTGMLPTSRSQTPQQQPNFSGNFPPGAIGQQGAGQFPHFKANGSATASPSPIMGNQMRPGTVPQRVATASPHPFSPSNPQFGPQTSPVPSEHGTPQPNQFMQNMPQGYNPSFAQSPSHSRPSPNPSAMAGGQMMPQGMGQMPQQMGQMQNMYAQMQQQQQQHQQGQPQPMGMPQQQHHRPQNPQVMTDQQKMAAYQMRLQQQLQGNMQMQAQMQAQNMGRGMMPKQQVHGMPNGQGPQGQANMMRPRMMSNINPDHFMKNLTNLMNARRLPLDTQPMIGDRPVNLLMLFQVVQNKGGYKASHPSSAPDHHRNSLSRGVETPGQPEFSMQSPAHAKPVIDERQLPAAAATEPPVPKKLPKSDEYTPCARELTTVGGLDLQVVRTLGTELLRWAPDVPPLPELGNIDIHALTKSIQSGIHGEVRVALDTLAAVSNSPHQPHFLRLPYCDDLVDSLVDCAEEQLEVLAEHTVEVSDEIQLTPYEELVRACRSEQWAVKDTPVFGSNEYELDRAVDRLICITTILRNVSFPGEANENHPVLADEAVVKFLSVVIRYLGTRTMLLRTCANTLDFMKDVVILLSNISGAMEIPGREQALCLLQFLLAFAPSPSPTKAGEGWKFTPYEPSLHPYLPHAVDALAKLFARDEPNRTHFKAIFTLDSTSNPSYELLTRTFALAVSPIPDKVLERNRSPQFPPLVETRKPFLMQGLLCAEILAALAPGSESGLTKSWLLSDNFLAQSLVSLIQRLSRQYEQPVPVNRGAARAAPRKDPELVYIVVTAVALLRRLAEKSKEPTGSVSAVLSFLPSSQSLMEVTSLTAPEWTKEGLLQQFTACVNLDR
ncbi:SWI/SNF chromatin-remodeling complex subunit-like protein [Hapsidospora chrysogenum ATCC 11550]|uniref:SWI/SNF chromatin-remodeling complex subunit-like protein n=1 Tax=Hapsidospora chrysogenum (strain ATCC 11550 / CBS 779.69 / DSM 880 / IAM 14645 / JCM 23072 / IMI 49137) TaxID=857340 RepID=A0A086TG82_HAPC1|nr:SWI/SNF chromatin-remodeling complex subunit-like protein [Hapsidospora chrysogenum ATCC 11550]